MNLPLLLCDIDGTLALRGDRSPHDHDQAMEDAVNWPIVHLVEWLDNYYHIVLISGREEKYRSITEYWLHTHNILTVDHPLYMRPTGDTRSDDIVKKEIYLTQIVPKYGDATIVLDDRNKVVKMWRELGLTCLQVADGDF